MSVGQRVAVTLYGRELYGRIARIGPGVVYVLTDDGRTRWFHAGSVRGVAS